MIAILNGLLNGHHVEFINSAGKKGLNYSERAGKSVVVDDRWPVHTCTQEVD